MVLGPAPNRRQPTTRTTSPATIPARESNATAVIFGRVSRARSCPSSRWADPGQRGATAVPAGGCAAPRSSVERPWKRAGRRARTANRTAVTPRTAPCSEGKPPGDFDSSHKTIGANATMAVRTRACGARRATCSGPTRTTSKPGRTKIQRTRRKPATRRVEDRSHLSGERVLLP